MSQLKEDQIRASVRKNYKGIALEVVSNGSCCSPNATTTEKDKNISIEETSKKMGYTAEELQSVPNGANMALGCGNPQAIAELKVGEVVLDLGSGGGFDSFLSSPKVGLSGKVIGVDMTAEMISKARDNATKNNFNNVEFRLGEIENLPVANDLVDVIISNCVINLSPNKERVFQEAYRVLKDGGRLAISDIVMTAEFPESLLLDESLYSKCVIGASTFEKLTSILENTGFKNISIVPKGESKQFIKEWAPEHNVEDYIVSAVIKAEK